MEHQDWKAVVLKPAAPQLVNNIVVKKKPTDNSSVKLDENDEVIQIKKVPREISQLITNARIAKKLSRKDLANQLNFKQDIIDDIETGKAIYNGNQIAKIKKHLGVK
jgi:ribosome-binding protein aMBF1 (putative translation factor)